MDGLAVRPADGKGRGVFATRDFAEGELIERCPVLIVPGDQAKRLRNTVLAQYFFRWIRDTPIVVIPLGYGSIYNHSRTLNAAEDEQALSETDLRPFVEDWPWGTAALAFPLGYAALYRSARRPNARVTKVPEDMVIEVVAAQDIDMGEEITVPERR